MGFTKEDLAEFTICELRQNVWCYTETIIERADRTKAHVFDYR